MEGMDENPHFWTSQVPVVGLVDEAIRQGVKEFTIFLENPSGVIPVSHPKFLKEELVRLVGQNIKLNFLKITRNGKIVCGTSNNETAIGLMGINELLSTPIVPRIVTENLTTKFILYNMPVNVMCREIAEELIAEGLPIQEVRRFQKTENGQKIPLKTVLVTKVGQTLPERVHLWFEEIRVRQFIDRPRQCNKCFQFSHSTKFCKNEIVCSRCGDAHESNQCKNTELKCKNCGDAHEVTNKQCKAYEREAEINRFKCVNHLTIMEARRRFPLKGKPGRIQTYAEAMKGANHEGPSCMKQNQDSDKMEKILGKFEETLQNFLTAQATIFRSMMQNMMTSFTNKLQSFLSLGTTGPINEPTLNAHARGVKKKKVSHGKSNTPPPTAVF